MVTESINFDNQNTPMEDTLAPKSCMKPSQPTSLRKRKLVTFEPFVSVRHYSSLDDPVNFVDREKELHRLGHISPQSVRHSRLRSEKKREMRQIGEVRTCVRQASGRGAMHEHISAQRVIEMTCHRLTMIQYRGLGRVSKPPSGPMMNRINEASVRIRQGIDFWREKSELKGARLESCVTTRNKKNLDSVAKLFEQYAEGCDESREAWIAFLESLDAINKTFLIPHAVATRRAREEH